MTALALVPAASANGLGGGGNVFPTPAPTNVAGELIVRFRPGTTGAERRDTRQDADTTLDHALAVPRAQLLDVERGQSVAQAMRELDRDRDVLYAEPNRRFATTALPNDARFGEMWDLNNTGQVVRGQVGLPGADIDALSGWGVTTGSPSVLVAIVDTGIDRSHPDLEANAWTNPGESGDKKDNGVDDDGNGLVDDWRGWDFDGNDNDPHDGDGHGTHVAGTIGAVGGNGIGVTGVNQHVSLVGVKVLDDTGSGTTASVADGFAYAGQLHAQVANASLGASGSSQVVADAIAGAPDTLFVVAAGNDGVDVDEEPFSPCAEPPDNIVCVAATDNRDDIATFSNFGADSVDLGAPGVGILSTLPNGSYGAFSGTSMASPHVAGTAALLAAAYPGESAGDRKHRLLSGVDPNSDLAGRTVSGGRVDIGGSLGQPANPPPTVRLDVTPTAPRMQQRITLDSSGSTDDGTIVARDWDLDGNGSYETRGTGTSATTAFDQHGDVTVGVRLRDDRGSASTQRVPLFVDWPPVDAPLARFRYTPERAISTGPVTLDATGSMDDVSIARYEWDLDGDWDYEVDGGTDPHYEKTFDTGTWMIGLRVTDSDGNVSETRQPVVVRSAPPVPVIEVSPDVPRENGLVQFASESYDPDGQIWEQRWSIDSDGHEWDDRSPHTFRRYDSPRVVTAYLTVEDNDGETATAERKVVIAPDVVAQGDAPPVATELPGESDGDGAIEPGESLAIQQSLQNRGPVPTTGISGSVHVPAPTGDLELPTSSDVTPRPAPGLWPDLLPGATAAPSAPLTADTYGSLTCGAPLDLELDVKTDQGETTVPVRVPPTGHVGAPISVPRTTFMPEDIKPLKWTYSSVWVPVHGAIKDLDVRIGELRHTSIGDIRLQIEPPEEEIFDDLVTIFDRHGGDGDDMLGMVLDSDAATPIASARPPFTGRFRPDSSLDRFDGTEAYGDWGFKVENWSPTETAHLKSMGFDVSPGECDDARNENPTAEIDAPTYAENGVPITLDASGSTDPDGHIVEYRWDLDGVGRYEASTEGPRKTATFYGRGYQEIGVQVIDDGRGAAEARRGVSVVQNAPPEARFTAPASITVGQPVVLDGSGSAAIGGSIVAWHWDLDRFSGESADTPEVTHSFREEGWHQVSLRVVDDVGLDATVTRWLWVSLPEAPVTPPDPPVTPPDPPVTPPGPWTPEPVGLFPSPLPGGDVGIPVAVPASSPVPAAHSSPPALRFNSPGRISLARLAAGLPLTAACDPGCDMLAELRVTPSTAKRIGLAGARGRAVVVGSRRRKLGSTDTELRLRVPARVRRVFARTRQVRARLELTAGSRGGVAHAAREIVVFSPRRR